MNDLRQYETFDDEGEVSYPLAAKLFLSGRDIAAFSLFRKQLDAGKLLIDQQRDALPEAILGVKSASNGDVGPIPWSEFGLTLRRSAHPALEVVG